MSGSPTSLSHQSLEAIRDQRSVDTVEVSVIVPARNAAEDLEDCLRHLKASQDCEFEIIVVDDASTDTTALVAGAMGVRVIGLSEQSGPAAARNRGAGEAQGDVLVFVDADVLVSPETLEQLLASLSDSDAVAAFGAYDTSPTARNLMSQYKNLMHHRVHQQANRDAWTFWTGCGVIRRSVFQEMNGFSEDFQRPSVEDIELGMRLRRDGHEVQLVPEIQVTHTKQWTPLNLFRTDVFYRGIPWTRLMLREGGIPYDLNIRTSQRLCVALTGLAVVLLGLLAWSTPATALLPVAALATMCVLDRWSARRPMQRPERVLAVALWSGLLITAAVLMPRQTALLMLPAALTIAINVPTWRFLANMRGRAFAILCIPFQFMYYLHCGISFALGTACHILRLPV